MGRPDAVLEVRASAAADTAHVWQLLAHPAAWPAWATHMAVVRRVDTSSAPGVVGTGDHLVIRLRGLPVGLQVEVTDVDPGRAWTFVARTPIGPFRSQHVVGKQDGGAVEVTVTITMPPATERVSRLLAAAYRPLARRSLERLGQIASAEQASRAVAARRMCQPSAV